MGVHTRSRPRCLVEALYIPELLPETVALIVVLLPGNFLTKTGGVWTVSLEHLLSSGAINQLVYRLKR